MQHFATTGTQRDAPSLDQSIVAEARAFVDALPDNIAPIPAVVPMANGNLQFEWNDGGRGLEIEFEAGQQIRYLKWAPNEQIEEEGVLPSIDYSSAVRLIRWFTGAILNA